jgi:hypothetical protein
MVFGVHLKGVLNRLAFLFMKTHYLTARSYYRFEEFRTCRNFHFTRRVIR